MEEHTLWKRGNSTRSQMEAGNGVSIKVWGYNWLPSLSNPRIYGPLITDLRDATVSSLLNPLTRQWNSSLLSSVFNQGECELIQQIQLCKRPTGDVLFWPYVQSGNYSAKSSYFFLKQENHTLAIPSQQLVEQSALAWKKIWKLSVPCKVRNSIWRSCRYAIPTKSNLARRCVVEDSTCSQCLNQ